jgi:glycosyltransferase involved in cell wall biosynthesis
MGEGKEGLFFKARDPDSLAEKILHLLKDRKIMEQMGKSGRTKALVYDWKKVTRQVLDFYSEVLDKKS